jgi:hypothetical protein
MNIQITILNHSISFGILNPLNCTKPLYFKYKKDERYSYNLILNAGIVFLYYSNLKNI